MQERLCVAQGGGGLPADKTREGKRCSHGIALAGIALGSYSPGDSGFIPEDIFRKAQNRTREEILH